MRLVKVTVKESSTRNIIIKADDCVTDDLIKDFASSISSAFQDNQDYEESVISVETVDPSEVRGRILHQYGSELY